MRMRPRAESVGLTAKVFEHAALPLLCRALTSSLLIGIIGGGPSTEQPSAATPQAEAAPQSEGGIPWGDPLSGKQWGMAAIQVPEASAITMGSRNVTVAIIDSGAVTFAGLLSHNFFVTASCSQSLLQVVVVGP